MNLLIIPDSFKDSISSKEIISALTKGFKSIDKNINIYSCVASDGGEGFIEAVSNSLKVEEIIAETVDPLGRKIKAKYLLDKKSKTAYIELAQASGLEHLKPEERNPMITSTKGTGLQIRDAINMGARKIIIGLGGSATTEAGLGIVQQMGYSFKDEKEKSLEPTGENLQRIRKISGTNIYPNVKFVVVNDVNNPLYGKNGAAHIYSAQKGANPSEIEHLDKGLRNLSELSKKAGFKDYSNYPGAGAAGGVAFGLMTFLNAKSISGIDFLFEISNVHQILQENSIDFIITGEGSLDSQSLQGKLIDGVCKLGMKFQIPVIAICGRLALDELTYKNAGILYATTIAPRDTSTAESMKNAQSYIEKLPKQLLPVMKSYLEQN